MPFSFCLLIGALLPGLHVLEAGFAPAGALFLFVSALELDLRDLGREWRMIFRLGCGAFIPPFLTGFALTFLMPGLFPHPQGVSALKAALVLAIAMSVSAVPVILKILQEAGLLATALGRRIVLTATFCDLAAWLLFLPLLPVSGRASWVGSHLTLLAFFVGLLTAYFVPGVLKRVRGLSWINQWLVAPVFFIGVGRSLDFSHGLNLKQIACVFVAASGSKIIGVLGATRGLATRSRGVMALSLNARGAMEVIMASLAMKSGLLNPDLFASLICMAIGTSVLIQPLLEIISF